MIACECVFECALQIRKWLIGFFPICFFFVCCLYRIATRTLFVGLLEYNSDKFASITYSNVLSVDKSDKLRQTRKKNEQNQTLICCAVNVGVPNQTNKDIQYRKQRQTAIGHSFWANEGNLWWKLINTTWLGNVIQLSLNSNGNKSKENWKSKLVNRSSINERQFGLLCEFLSVSKSQRKISL